MISHPEERFKGLALFVTVADSGSFTAAGERLGLTNSAVGKGVARLESRLGVRLFERTTRTLSLTDAGATFYRTCVQMLSALEDAEAVFASRDVRLAGRIRVDVPTVFGRLFILPILLQFVADHPDVHPHISFSDRFVDLIDEGIDIAVRIGGSEARPATIGHKQLGTERLIFCAAPTYLQQFGIPSSIADLGSHRCLTYGRADGSASPWRIQSEDGQRLQRQISDCLTIGDGEALVKATVAGAGIAQLATWLVADQIKQKTLVPILPKYATDGLSLHILWPRTRDGVPKVRALLDLLTTALELAALGERNWTGR